jgi:hypothetical protein
MKPRPLDRADARPRIHLWQPRAGGWAWSIGPVGTRMPCTSAGAGIDAALLAIGRETSEAGFVVIGEEARAA